MTASAKDDLFLDIPKEESVSNLRSRLGAFPRGALETYRKLSKIFERDLEGPGPVRKVLEENPELFQKEGLQGVLEKAFPKKTRFQEAAESEIEKAFPISEEDDISQFLRKFGSGAAVPLPGMSLPQFLARAGGAAASSTLAKQLGLGPVGQAISEIPAWLLSPSFSSKLIPPKGLENTYKVLEEFGLSPEAITRATQSTKKSSILGKFSSKGEKAQEALEATQGELGEFYRDMRSLPESKSPIDQQLLTGLVEEWTPIAKDMPAIEKDLIERDLLDLFKGPGDADSLMSFWAKLNKVFKGRGEALQKFKTGITDVLYAHDPALGERFDLWNNLYRHFSKTASKLSPTLQSEFFNVMHGYDLAKGIVSGDNALVKTALTNLGLGKLPEKFLLSPRLQNLAAQVKRSIIKGSPQQSTRLIDGLLSKVEEENNMYEGSPIPEIWEP